MKRTERGQAALLGVVGVIVLAVGMYTSYNLSRAVYEKIQLQNAADAAAYSLATLEARTFNFIAFANRAQVANYVQMLELQSMLSSLTFAEGATAALGEGAIIASVPLRFFNPALGQALEQAGRSMEQTYRGVMKPAVDAADQFVPQQIRMLTAKNTALFGVSVMLALATASQLVFGGLDVAQANDPDAEMLTLARIGLSAVNTASFISAFDFAAVSVGGDSDGAKRMKRAMAEMVNASRYGLGDPGFIVSRGPFAAIGELTAAQGVGGRIRGFAGTLFGFLGQFSGFVGTTKMLSEGDRVADLDDTGEHSFDHSDLARGDVITAKDMLPIWGDFASVRSSRTDGRHCRYKDPGGRYGSLSRTFQLANGRVFECDDDSHNRRHRWQNLLGRGGIQPYLSFAPQRHGISVEETPFNQPDVWVWLTKRPGNMALEGDMDLDFEMAGAELDARIGGDGLLGSGLVPGVHAIARAQVYYHRPGAWHEPPNFFNPYWGARLAPKGAALDGVFRTVSLPGPIANFLADNIWMH
jgi:hypothetical protein